MRMLRITRALAILALLNSQQPLQAWGFHSHTVANLAAVEAISSDGPVFLKSYKAYIGLPNRSISSRISRARAPSSPCASASPIRNAPNS